MSLSGEVSGEKNAKSEKKGPSRGSGEGNKRPRRFISNILDELLNNIYSDTSGKYFYSRVDLTRNSIVNFFSTGTDLKHQILTYERVK